VREREPSGVSVLIQHIKAMNSLISDTSIVRNNVSRERATQGYFLDGIIVKHIFQFIVTMCSKH
jgi:hypothetical protein